MIKFNYLKCNHEMKSLGLKWPLNILAENNLNLNKILKKYGLQCIELIIYEMITVLIKKIKSYP